MNVLCHRYRQLFAVSFAVDAAGPAAWSTDAFGKFGMGALDATRPGINQFGRFYPTNPFVARQWCNVIPCR
jgi:hypothetical protein